MPEVLSNIAQDIAALIKPASQVAEIKTNISYGSKLKMVRLSHHIHI